jgi:iron-sulfur cluster assembly accessory protein
MNLTVTEKALKELRVIFADQNFDIQNTYARLAVHGGGCSGFQHKFFLDENYDEKQDIVVEIEGVKFVTDRRSALYLDGTTVDFLEQLDKRGFKFSNPSVKSTCGCGSSFSL